MKFDFEKLSNKDFEKINFKKYDFVIVGSGPAATVLLYELVKRNKKILVIEKGNYLEKKYEEIKSINFKIKKKSRTFAVGGTSQDWSNISSYFENFELSDIKTKKNVWPLTHSKLLKLYKNLDDKFGFEFKNFNKIKLNIPFTIRKFIANIKPKNYKFFHTATDYDLLFNANLDYFDEKNSLVQLYISFNSKKKIINVKNVTLCNGGIESTALILKSLKKGKLKKLKNKNYVGRYFMDHPKSYIGQLIYPKKNILEQIKLKVNKGLISYYGISLKQKDQRDFNFLNSYIRFEKKNKKLSSLLNIIDKNFGKGLNKLINFEKKEIYLIKLFLEMEPVFSNRIVIDKNENVICKLRMNIREENTVNFLLKKIYTFFSEKPKEEKINTFKKFKNKLEGASHHIGGLCYPKVVNKNLKINGLKNIYCCSSSIFPTSGSVNPTMTICALALRLSEYLNKRY